MLSIVSKKLCYSFISYPKPQTNKFKNLNVLGFYVGQNNWSGWQVAAGKIFALGFLSNHHGLALPGNFLLFFLPVELPVEHRS